VSNVISVVAVQQVRIGVAAGRQVVFQLEGHELAVRVDGAGGRFDTVIRSGEVADQAELARLGLVTRARMTQIMDLLSLAPDIQEQLLYLPAIAHGRDVVTERTLRPVVADLDWGAQRAKWERLRPTAP
jgi:hypothetical protein